ncbi:ATP-binding protein [Nocardioides aurantiacus]|uniref:Anti-sigma regulatory factor (Ser/Thr protein kinase) n=1 Tax=Nocardioides aurantiacus TaxID=86796 RepID=A0A3N2CZH9_9ACTN|nr:ATP-binding protein [Nocardioides aurantiacus]ROR92604.1 anti-sigma regulatory factor (Ser/Thr protein kinase) [Nocardioides aurantiacus]
MVPLTKRSLVLPASPPSVKLARSWVTRVLAEIGRDDLVESAALGVSELVTNALIHSKPPLSVRIRGTVDHPRIEVVDSSPVPPQRSEMSPEPEDVDDLNVTTFGRGLDLVAMMSARWGSDLAHDGSSKSVWFEPQGDSDESGRTGEIFDFDPDFGLEDSAEGGDEPQLSIQLLGLPPRLFSLLRTFYYETRRELRLLSLTSPEGYPLAHEMTAAYVQADRERRVVVGISTLDQAIADGLETVDLDYLVPATAPATMSRLRDLYVEIYREFADEHLLALRPPEVIVQLQNWYFTEFERQGRGDPPLPWDGPTTVATTA